MNTAQVTATQQVIVTETAANVVEVSVPTAPAIIEIITEGPQGAAGQSEASYTHTQSSPAATWTINHNLGFKPSVELLNAGSQEIEGDVLHPSTNQAVVYFTSSVAGFARLT